ncbi:PucR family transcriptional regulator [uncultured Flavonifractor sp.]|uniref:PucR family transcriptional regulator n=1 Tax=uncultured Flavonifractor sp. TaxID=1193534 RepID=UPI00263775BF|nr:PucR family transcriptional regulator [uncultured Flavonifractor sp.]
MAPAVPLSVQPSLSELLGLHVFQGSRLLAGHGCLERGVSGVNLSDTPEYYKWLSPGELMVTTCYSIRNDPAALADFVPTLASKGMSGLLLKPGTYLGEVPPVMLASALQLDFPLVELPESVRFSDITKAISDELIRRQTALLRSTLTVNEMLTRTIVEGANLDEIAHMVSDLTGSSVLILDSINNRRTYCLTEADGARFAELTEEKLCRDLIAGARMHVLEVGGHSFGFLYIYNSDPGYEELDYGIMAQVLQAIPLEIARERTVRERGDQHFNEFLLHLLSDPISDEHLEMARAAAYGLDLTQNHIVLRARITERPGGESGYAGVFQRTLLVNDIRTTLSNLGFILYFLNSSDEFLMVMSTSLESRNLSPIVDRLPELIDHLMEGYAGLLITAGCGRPHSGLTGLIQSDKEARMALRAALSRGEGLTCFDNLGLLRLIYTNEPDREIDAFIQETLGKLLDRDQAKGAELFHTLETYFQCYGNLKRMSEEMYAHYNTIVYRLKSIREITGLDVHQPTQRFQLELALRLYRLTRWDKH